MSKYTTEVRFICEVNSGLGESVGYSSVDDVITKAVPKIFDFDFPIFDEAYRAVLCKKILKHYYVREIAHETVGLWKLRLNTKLNEIMPYYNQLYKSELLEFNPFYNVEYTKEGNRTNESEKEIESSSENEGEGTNDRINKFSETPQGGLTDLINGEYLTTASQDSNTSTVKNNNSYNESNNVNSTDEYLEKVKGKVSGESYSTLLKEFRSTFMNIDMMIIKELESLFFMLW